MDRKISLVAALIAVGIAAHAALTAGDIAPAARSLLAAGPFLLLSAAFGSLKSVHLGGRRAATGARGYEAD